MAEFTKFYHHAFMPGLKAIPNTVSFQTSKTAFVDHVLKPCLVDGFLPETATSINKVSSTNAIITFQNPVEYIRLSCLLIASQSIQEINQECRVISRISATSIEVEFEHTIDSMSAGIIEEPFTVKLAPLGWKLLYEDRVSATNVFIFGTDPARTTTEFAFKYTHDGSRGHLMGVGTGANGAELVGAFTEYSGPTGLGDNGLLGIGMLLDNAFDNGLKKIFIIGTSSCFYIGADSAKLPANLLYSLPIHGFFGAFKRLLSTTPPGLRGGISYRMGYWYDQRTIATGCLVPYYEGIGAGYIRYFSNVSTLHNLGGRLEYGLADETVAAAQVNATMLSESEPDRANRSTITYFYPGATKFVELLDRTFKVSSLKDSKIIKTDNGLYFVASLSSNFVHENDLNTTGKTLVLDLLNPWEVDEPIIKEYKMPSV